jgi:hypothetical protein
MPTTHCDLLQLRNPLLHQYSTAPKTIEFRQQKFRAIKSTRAFDVDGGNDQAYRGLLLGVEPKWGAFIAFQARAQKTLTRFYLQAKNKPLILTLKSTTWLAKSIKQIVYNM